MNLHAFGRRSLRALLLVALSLALGSCQKTPSGTALDSAQEFFTLLQKGEITQAYADTAFAFQAQQSEKAFDARVKELGLIGPMIVELHPEEAADKTARFSSEVTTNKGQKLALVVNLQIDAGKWRVFSLKTPRSTQTGVSENQFSLVGKTAAFNDAVSQPMPSEKSLRVAIRSSMLQFNDAIQRRSFSDFYNHVALAWQSQLTEKQLQRAFQTFIDQGVNLAGISDVEPILDAPPQVLADGLLIASGYYPTKPYQVVFSLKFVYELPNWKLFGLDVNLRQAPKAEGQPATPPQITVAPGTPGSELPPDAPAATPAPAAAPK